MVAWFRSCYICSLCVQEMKVKAYPLNFVSVVCSFFLVDPVNRYSHSLENQPTLFALYVKGAPFLQDSLLKQCVVAGLLAWTAQLQRA